MQPKRQLLILIFFVLFDIRCAVFLLEPFYPPGGIDILLLAGIKRMARRANLGVDFLHGAAGLERVAAPATNHYLMVFWMYLVLHKFNSPK